MKRLPQTLCLISLGCNKNLVDSEVMLGRLREYRLIDDVSSADVIIINTCGFIASAKQESINKILEVARDKKDNSKLVVSGCLSQRYAKELQDEIPEIDIITGVGEYDKIDTLLEQKKTDSTTSGTFLIDNHDRVIIGSKIHAYIKISEGCNQICSFCAIPNIKGKLHSRSIESCLKEIRTLIDMGYKDFSFLAQDSSSYMHDMGKKDALISLIDKVEQIEGIRSARILYLYPTTTSKNLIYRIAESSVFQNYFDMPLQHISNAMLNNMRRGLDRNRHIELLESMRNIGDSFVRTTFLIGHPNESERDFDELCEFVNDFVFDRVNIFAFSSEEGTKAHTMKHKVDIDTTNMRIDILNNIIQRQQNEIFKRYEGKKIQAIIDGVSSKSDLLYSARDVKWDREIDGEILINENLTPIPLESNYYEVKIESYKQSNSERYLIGKALKRL